LWGEAAFFQVGSMRQANSSYIHGILQIILYFGAVWVIERLSPFSSMRSLCAREVGERSMDVAGMV